MVSTSQIPKSVATAKSETLLSKIQSLAAGAMGRQSGTASTYLNPKVMVGLVVVAMCATIPMDIADLSLAIVGAVCYWSMCRLGRREKQKKFAGCKLSVGETNFTQKPQRNQLPLVSNQPQPHAKQQALSTPAKPDYRKTSSVPVLAPKFSSSCWDGEVNELLSQIKPTAHSHEIVQRLVRIVEDAIKPVFPRAIVKGCVNGNPVCARAFGVAVPEVDIVVNASPETFAKSQPGFANMNSRQIQKFAIRTCCNELVSAGLKFRRSAFQSDEPKVILLVPTSLGLADVAFATNFSVNTLTAFRAVDLLNECDQLEARARELVLIVQRWARDRGIAHAAKGHLPPYAWSLLAIYFLQVGVADEEGPLLPPLDSLSSSPRCTKDKRGLMDSSWPRSQGTKKTPALLFKEFVKFYMSEFDWTKEIVSVRLGSRTKSKFQSTPFVQDPFESASNVGAFMNVAAMDRLREELSRAHALCSRGGSLAELLEPWAPPLDVCKEDDDADVTDMKGHQKQSARVVVDAAKPGSLTCSVPSLRPNAGLGRR